MRQSSSDNLSTYRRQQPILMERRSAVIYTSTL